MMGAVEDLPVAADQDAFAVSDRVDGVRPYVQVRPLRTVRDALGHDNRRPGWAARNPSPDWPVDKAKRSQPLDVAYEPVRSRPEAA